MADYEVFVEDGMNKVVLRDVCGPILTPDHVLEFRRQSGGAPVAAFGRWYYYKELESAE